jgi:hypothetical protein
VVIFKKLIIYCIAIIMIIYCIVGYSYSKDIPPEGVIQDLIVKVNIYYGNVSSQKNYRNIKFNYFNINNSFLSKHNGRYCVSVDSFISYESRYTSSTTTGWKNGNKKIVNGEYSFEKKGNQWFGWKGWGPGEY